MNTIEPQRIGPLDWYFKSNLLVRILIGLVLGAVAGLIVGPDIRVISPLGDLFVRLLKMIVIPIVLTTLVVGAASISPARLGRVGAKIVVFYLLTSAFAVAIGLVIANLFKPGMGLALGAGQAAGKELTQPSLITTILNIVPTNPFAAIASGDVLPVIFFAIIFGVAVSYLRISSNPQISGAAETILKVFEGAAEAMYVVVRWILQYAPIGVFALIAVVFGTQGATAFGPLAIVTLSVYLALAIHLFLTYGGLLAINKLNLFTFIRGAREAMITAFVSRSSSGTLPVTLRNAEENLGAPRTISSFTPASGCDHQHGRHRDLSGCVRAVHRVCHRIAAEFPPADHGHHHRGPRLDRYGGRSRSRSDHAADGPQFDRSAGNAGFSGRAGLRHDSGHRCSARHGPHQPQRDRRYGGNGPRLQGRRRARPVEVEQRKAEDGAAS